MSWRFLKKQLNYIHETQFYWIRRCCLVFYNKRTTQQRHSFKGINFLGTGTLVNTSDGSISNNFFGVRVKSVASYYWCQTRELWKTCFSYCGSCSSSLVSLEVFSLAQILFIVQATAIRCSVFLFSPFFYFSSLWNLKIWFNQSLVFYCFLFLLSILFIHLLFSTLLSVPCSVAFFQTCYPFFSLFLLCCYLCFSLMLYYYSLCSLSVILHLFWALYLILICYLFCSCFCFL